MADHRDRTTLPDGMLGLRHMAGIAALWVLWLAVPLLAWLAGRGDMGWELVAALGAGLALAGTAARRCGHRVALAAAVAASCLLLLGAGRGTLPDAARMALPFAALALAGALCDGRALAVSTAVLVAQAALPLAAAAGSIAGAQARVAGLVACAYALHLAQRVARRALRARGTVLVPASRPTATVWSLPCGDGGPHGLMVQAERAPDGTVRLAVTGTSDGRVRVTVS